MTIAMCASMSAMGVMEMPGGWTMSHMWMLAPGQTWLGATASFVGMWVVMMVTMMLPSLTPTLLCYRASADGTGAARLGVLTVLAAIGYFAVWTAVGVIVFPLGVVLADIVMRKPELSRAVPLVVGTTLLIAGVLQHTPWKARHLAFCREESGRPITPSCGTGAALYHGWLLGVHCSQACAGLTAVGLALGVMDLRVMVGVMAAITVERLAPKDVRAPRAIGVVVVAVGIWVIGRAAGLGSTRELVQLLTSG